MTRLFQAIPLSLHITVTLDPSASHHLANVLRTTVGEPVTLFNGEGGEYAGTIHRIDKKQVIVKITEFIEREAESPLQLTLAQGISRGEKMDYTIQKAVELGVKTIVPLITERCNVKLDAQRWQKRLQHWQAIIISACEQSGRNRVPEITPPQPLAEWLPTVTSDVRFVLSPHTKSTAIMADIASITLLVGPEGGLSEKEMVIAKQYHFSSIQLGPRILRTETAAVAAIAAIQSQLGDMKFV